jgi:hypothetical protein
MTTDVKVIPCVVLDEVEGIVEAEWMRLTQDWDQWEQELAGFLAELPAPRCRPRSYTTAVGRRSTAFSPPRRSVMSPSRRSPAPTVWATQRSPPAATPGSTIQTCSRTNGGDALTGGKAMTRAGPQQHHSLRDTTHHRPTMCAHNATDRGTTQWAVRDVIATGAALAHRPRVRRVESLLRVSGGHRSSAVSAAFNSTTS